MTASGSSSDPRAISTSTAEPAPAGPPSRLNHLAGFALLVGTGFADAYTYLRHGHVFAEAMTGNIVLIGVGAADPRVVAFWRPLLAFLVFLAGVITLDLLARADPVRRSGGAIPQFATIAIQVVVLGIVGFLPRSFSQAVITSSISFAAGMQSSAFRRIGRTSLSTVVMTTNSTQAVGALIDALRAGDPLQIARARSLLVAVCGFVVGVFLGAELSVVMHNRAAWADSGAFVIAGLLYTLHDRRTRALT